VNWYNDLPKGAKVLILIVVTIIAVAVIFRSGQIIGEALAKTSHADEGE